MRERLDGLDGWRAIGAIMVIVAHLQVWSPLSGGFLGGTALGALGVDYFFGISGFVIARGLLNREGHPGLRGFYVRRFFRIVPPLAIYLAVVVALSLFGIVRATSDWRCASPDVHV